MNIGNGQYAVLSAVVFAIGLYGVFARRHPLAVVMALGLLFAAPLIALAGFISATASTSGRHVAVRSQPWQSSPRPAPAVSGSRWCSCSGGAAGARMSTRSATSRSRGVHLQRGLGDPPAVPARRRAVVRCGDTAPRGAGLRGVRRSVVRRRRRHPRRSPDARPAGTVHLASDVLHDDAGGNHRLRRRSSRRRSASRSTRSR